MHPSSTSSNIASKPVVYESQMAVIERFLSGAADPKRYRVIKSPLFAGSPDWWIRRDRSDAPPLTTLLLSNATGAAVAELPSGGYPNHAIVPVPLAGGLQAIATAIEGRSGLIHLLWDQVEIRQPEWAWEAQTMFELFPDAVAVGGRVFDRHRRILSAGSLFGFGRGCDPPDRGRPASDPGYFATAWKQHSTSAVSSQHMVVRREFLAAILPGLIARAEASIAYLGAWAGAEARRTKARIIYSPFMEGTASADWDALVTDRERSAFVMAHAALMPERQLLSPHLGLDSSAPFGWSTAQGRADHQQRLRSWAETRAG